MPPLEHPWLPRLEELCRRLREAVRETLGDMKGALMKLGQMASYIDQGLPPHVRDALSGLQSSAPPMSPSPIWPW